MDSSPVPVTCVNCDGPITSPRRPFLYCSELCQQEAEYVRYKRRKVRDGSISNPDIQEELETQFALILGGGYPERERRLTTVQRDAVIARDGGRCRLCGAPGLEIDHIGAGAGPDGDMNHPDNLQLLCTPCHREKTRNSFRTVTLESDRDEWWRHLNTYKELEQRVYAKMPERLSDDEQKWPHVWQGVAKERTATINAQNQRPLTRSRRRPNRVDIDFDDIAGEAETERELDAFEPGWRGH